jgi:hypothetical protein
MTQKVFALDTQPGIQRDGTVFDKEFYTDGRWVRFQRGRPRKILGYRLISNGLQGPSRGMWMNPNDGINRIFTGYDAGLQELTIDNNGIGAGVTNFTLSNFTSSINNVWQFDGYYNPTGGVGTIIAHPGQNLTDIDSTINTPVLYGSITGSSMSKVGVFTDTATTTNTSATIVLAASNTLIAAGQAVTGTGIPANTTVVSVSTTNVVISNPATANGTVTVTFDNNVDVSGGCVSLHPYLFVYGNNGLIRNNSANDLDDWVSADANETNVATTKIVQGLPVRGGSNAPSGLFWSLDSLIRVSFVGGVGTPAQYWRYDIITSQSSILSSQSAIEYGGIYYWCGVDSFLMYNGVVKEIPNNFNMNYFFDNLNYAQRQKVWVAKVPRWGEIWWYYPRGDSAECNDAIIYNTREQCWYDAGTALGVRRSAGFYSQVFPYPITASWEETTEAVITTQTLTTTSGDTHINTNTVDSALRVGLAVSGSNIASGTLVSQLTASGLNTIGAITGGSLYTNGTYTDVPLTTTSGTGFSAQATIVVSGGAVTSVTITFPGYNYSVGAVVSAAAASIGGTGSGFSTTVTALWTQVIHLSLAATASGSGTLTFTTPAGYIGIWQHEIGVDAIEGQNSTAIESYFETNDLGLLSGGPSEPSRVGENIWLRLERVEPDFVQEGEMECYVTGRPFAQSQDTSSDPYVFDPDTGKIDMREQRRELRLKFRSNVQGGNYQLGKVVLNADIGDVRP